MAANETGNRLRNGITSERFIRFAPNLVSNIYSSSKRDLWSQKPEILDPRWQPAAILNFAKTFITFEPFIRFLPNLAWIFVQTLPRHGRVKDGICQNPTWPPVKNLKFTINGITSEWFIRFAPNFTLGIVYSIPKRCPQSQNLEIHSAIWPPVTISNFWMLYNIRTIHRIFNKFDVELRHNTA